jgi:hypothetical protein
MNSSRRTLIRLGAALAASPALALLPGCQSNKKQLFGGVHARKPVHKVQPLPRPQLPANPPQPDYWILIYGWGSPWEVQSEDGSTPIVMYGEDPNKWPKPSSLGGPRLYASRSATAIKFKLSFFCWMERQANTQILIKLHTRPGGVQKNYIIPFPFYVGSCVSRWMAPEGQVTIPASEWVGMQVDDYDWPDFWLIDGCKPGGQ